MALLGDVSMTFPASTVDYSGEHLGGYRRSNGEIKAFAALLESDDATGKAKAILDWFQFFPDDLLKARKLVEKNRLKRISRARRAEQARAARNRRNRERYARLSPEEKRVKTQQRSFRRLLNQACGSP